MTDDSRGLATEGVRFFGEMTASISHEIKNVLAIINENAGLLQDMLAIHEKGVPLAPQRLSAVAQSIARQVDRGDRIVKRMNRFAHSADDPEEVVDVAQIIHFISDVAARRIAMLGAAPQIETPTPPLTIRTNRFFLENLVWACLYRAMSACTAGQRARVVAAKTDNTVWIRFSGFANGSLGGRTDFPSSRETMVAGLLGAQLAVDPKDGQIVMILPHR